MIVSIILLLVAIPFALYFYNHYKFNSKQKPLKEKFLANPENKLPKFSAKDLNFTHTYVDDGNSMPFLDTKIIYPYDDDRVAVIQTGGDKQDNVVLLNDKGNFTDITSELKLEGFKNETAYSIAYEDIDDDGKKEIVIGYASGVYVHKREETGFAYKAPTKLFDVPEASIAVDIAFADTRGNGLLDVYVATFVDKKHFTSATYHDNTNKRQNLFMVNNGDGTYTEKSKEAGLHLIQNSYFAKFVDLNNNGKPDLVLSLNTDVGRIYENLGDGTFKQHLLPIDYGFWMGLSIEKLDNKTDKYAILMSNIGKSFPVAIVRGDLKKDEVFDPHYALLEQVNDFEFKNVTQERNLDSNVFGWGLVLADLNNNGRKDAVFTENYIQFPAKIHHNFPSKGKVFMQGQDGVFAPFQEEVGLLNPNFGYKVLAHDFTGNGFKDVIVGNINGPIKFFENMGL